MSSNRTIITFSDNDKSWLEAFSKRHGISIAEAVRRGVLELKKKESENLYKTLVHETQGIWEECDGLEYQEKIRSEWGE